MQPQVETEKKLCVSHTTNPHDKRERIAKWFHARFGLLPSQDRLYFDEWVHRFAIGSAYRFMDSKSLEIWNKVRKGAI